MDTVAEVVFKHGSLSMSRDKTDIIMTGPATLVAIGKYYYGIPLELQDLGC